MLDIDELSRQYEAIEAYEREAHRRIAEERHRLIDEPSHVRKVIRRHVDYDEVLQIERIVATDNGTIVYVR